MATKKEAAQAQAQTQALAATEAPKGPFVHQLQLYLVGGQQFTVNEVTDTVDMPRNVIAFVNAWREKKDVWHSPNNDPRFGVRVRDVSMYEYRVGRPAPAPAQKAEAAEEVK